MLQMQVQYRSIAGIFLSHYPLGQSLALYHINPTLGTILK